jgi:hypothetical protein
MYHILLGRPFNVLTESIIKNYANSDQTITICDPNTGKVTTIPTISRRLSKQHVISCATSIVSYNELATEFSILDPSTQSRILSFLYLLYCDLDVLSKDKLDYKRKRMRRSQTKIPGFAT